MVDVRSFGQGQANATLNVILQPPPDTATDSGGRSSGGSGSSGGSSYELIGVNPWSGEVVYRAMLTNEQQVKIVQLGYA